MNITLKIRILFIQFFVIHSIISQTKTISGPTGSGAFGYQIHVLKNGNFIVTDPYFDEGSNVDIGAVYLFNGTNQTLISTLKGKKSGDKIGDYGIIVLKNDNYLVISNSWQNGSIQNAGAVTFCNNNNGLNGIVDETNSLVGSSENDRIGWPYDITTLPNGNYVVSSPNWDNGNSIDAGAVTFGNGSTGIVGSINNTNSLVGTKTNDQVGVGGIFVTANGNYVVRSYDWGNGSNLKAGAATFGNQNTGVFGNVNDSNSLIGTNANDRVSNGGIFMLKNGNYVVSSPIWDFGTNVDYGAGTFCNGITGLSGYINSENSFIGSNIVTPLENGNYVISNPSWDNGSIIDAGAVTLIDGQTGLVGTHNSQNSFVGSSNYNNVGWKITPLPNGNFVVTSPFWDDNQKADVGAVTLINGSTGLIGEINSTNSLIGTNSNERLGVEDIVVLTNSNYVIRHPNWKTGFETAAGAVTFGNGLTGITGTINSNNSLVGKKSFDLVGGWGVTALKNGNYVVSSPSCGNDNLYQAGSITLGSGINGVVGNISENNSLVGSKDFDGVGNNGATALKNGNFVVVSSNWANGNALKAGAVTLVDGITGLVGSVNSNNSLVGSGSNNQIGNYGITELINGNFLIKSGLWDNGSLSDVGAVTFVNGLKGLTGIVNISNSLVGSNSLDNIGNGVYSLSNSNFLINSTQYNNGLINDAGAITFGNGTNGISGIISNCNSVIGNIPSGTNPIGPVFLTPAFNDVYNYFIVGKSSENIITLFSDPYKPLANGFLNVNYELFGNVEANILSNDGCQLISTINPSGNNPVDGQINAKVWIENNQPEQFVKRHYQITTQNDNATASITLYFTQAEFLDFNGIVNNNLKLPSSPNDISGISNIRIGTFLSMSLDETGLPNSYYSNQVIIDPIDSNIKWNNEQNRWEVTFECIDFGGFIVQTDPNSLNLKMASVKSGDWNDPTVWSLNRIPNSNDILFISHEITITNSYHVKGLCLETNGYLKLVQNGSVILNRQ